MYLILSARALTLNEATSKLTNDVIEAIVEGWTLQGGVSVSNEGIDGHYVVAQAMTKK